MRIDQIDAARVPTDIAPGLPRGALVDQELRRRSCSATGTFQRPPLPRFLQELLPGLRPCRPHRRFAAVRTESKMEIESGEDSQRGRAP